MKWTTEMDNTLKALDLQSCSILEQCAGMVAKFGIPFNKNQITSARTRLRLTKPRKSRHGALNMPCCDASDLPEPEACHTPARDSACKFRGEFMGRDIGLCEKEIVAGSYCAEHYILTRGDKEAARATIERLAGR